MNLTDWYPNHIKPVRIGMYEADCGMRHWHGDCWRIGANKIDALAHPHFWRGIASGNPDQKPSKRKWTVSRGIKHYRPDLIIEELVKTFVMEHPKLELKNNWGVNQTVFVACVMHRPLTKRLGDPSRATLGDPLRYWRTLVDAFKLWFPDGGPENEFLLLDLFIGTEYAVWYRDGPDTPRENIEGIMSDLDRWRKAAIAKRTSREVN
jgi:hypothetical protein